MNDLGQVRLFELQTTWAGKAEKLIEKALQPFCFPSQTVDLEQRATPHVVLPTVRVTQIFRQEL